MAEQTTDTQSGEVVWEIDNLLKDPTKRAAILQRLGPADFLHLTPGGMAGGGGSRSGFFQLLVGRFRL